MPRVNLSLADDVGLDKTIETGLVPQELTLRHRIRSALIVCPSGLQIPWREQMRDKFGLDFRIVDSDAMKEPRRKRGLHVKPMRAIRQQAVLRPVARAFRIHRRRGVKLQCGAIRAPRARGQRDRRYLLAVCSRRSPSLGRPCAWCSHGLDQAGFWAAV